MLYPFLLGAAIIFLLCAHWKVAVTYARYSRVQSKKGLTGKELAAHFLEYSKAGKVGIEEIKGTLTDHYDPVKKVIRLSKGVSGGQSLSALGIAGHEAAHAVQDRKGYLPFRARNAIAPLVSTGAFLSPVLFVASGFDPNSILSRIALVLLFLVVIFHVITLPVEIDASNRALVFLERKNYLQSAELEKTRKVLFAAALTYVAATLMAVFGFFAVLARRR